MGLFGADEDDTDEPPLGQETWDAVEELTEKQETDPDGYQEWSDAIDRYNEENPDEELRSEDESSTAVCNTIVVYAFYTPLGIDRTRHAQGR